MTSGASITHRIGKGPGGRTVWERFVRATGAERTEQDRMCAGGVSRDLLRILQTFSRPVLPRVGPFKTGLWAFRDILGLSCAVSGSRSFRFSKVYVHAGTVSIPTPAGPPAPPPLRPPPPCLSLSQSQACFARWSDDAYFLGSLARCDPPSRVRRVSGDHRESCPPRSVTRYGARG